MTRELLDELTQQEVFVVALYLRAGSLNKQQLYEYADSLRMQPRRQLLKKQVRISQRRRLRRRIRVRPRHSH